MTLMRAPRRGTAVKDKDFLDDAERMHIEIDPLPGTDLQNLVAKIYATPRDIVEQAKTAIKT